MKNKNDFYITIISDTHGLHKRHYELFEYPNADMIIHAGDISSVGTITQISSFLHWFENLPYKYKIFIAGNHDWGFENNSGIIKSMIPEDIIYLEDNSAEIEGIKFWGTPVSPKFNNWAFNKQRGDEIKKYWDLIPEGIDVLITHSPPFGILDYVEYNHEYVGCQDLFNSLDRIKPKLHCFGHIHNMYGRYETETCKFINASSLNGRYIPAHKPFKVKINKETKNITIL